MFSPGVGRVRDECPVHDDTEGALFADLCVLFGRMSV